MNSRRKYVNLFEGLNNTMMMNFEELKRTTFREIFTCNNLNAKSIKKPLNFQNYSNERQDIISKIERNPAYDKFYPKLV